MPGGPSLAEKAQPVGLVGLGRMGGAMCRTLLRHGRAVVAWDVDGAARERSRADGAAIAADPTDVARRARVVITSLPDAHALRDVLFGPAGLMAEGSRLELLVDTSTTFPHEAREIAGELASRGVGFVDAPVSGGVAGAETGTLSVMAGGTPRDVELARPVLEPLARSLVHCGPSGAGQVAKACNQLIVMTTLEAVAETLVLADEVGLDPRRIREALMTGFAASPLLENQGLRMLERDFEPGGRSLFHLKDIATIRGLAAEVGLELPAFAVAAERIERLVAAGGGDMDHSALVTVVERRPLGRSTPAGAVPDAPPLSRESE